MLPRCLAAIALAACGPDLPAGWEDARPVTSLVQTACLDASPYEPHDERAEGDLGSSPYQVSLKEGHFRCEQEVAGFYRLAGAGVDVLVQPADMNPRLVAGCDCLYDIDMTLRLEVDLAPERVTVYRRWDNLNDPNEPVEIGAVLRP